MAITPPPAPLGRAAVRPIVSPVLAGTAHGFFDRIGGVSSGLYASLNCGPGSGDDPALVAENRARALAAVAPGARLVTVHQVHGPDCVVAGPWADDARPRADALVTDRHDLALGVLTADCLPVLLADREAGVIGAAHAGWRGLAAGVLASVVATMERLGARASAMVAVIGPAIGPAHFEVGDEVRAAFAAKGDEACFQPRGERWLADLPGLALDRLAAAGVQATALPHDTYAGEARWFSYRRATHRGERDYGRQLSLIALARPTG